MRCCAAPKGIRKASPSLDSWGWRIAFETVLYEKEGGLAWITLNRPRVLNALNTQMRDDLFQVFTAVQDDLDIRAVVVMGAGERAFCVGADLTEFGTAPPPVEARAVRWARDLWGTILRVEVPLIAAMHGYVLGAGLELALCCDIRLASEDAQFGLPEAGLGIIPAGAGTQTLPRSIAPGVALELMLRGRRFDAAEAWGLGLVNRVVPRARLRPVAERLARKIAAWDSQAVRLVKEAVHKGLDLPLTSGLEMEHRLWLILWEAQRQKSVGEE